MITAANIKYLTELTVKQIESIGKLNGYYDCRYETATFVGLTNGGQFCYSVTWFEDNETQTGKVYLSYDSSNDRVMLDF